MSLQDELDEMINSVDIPFFETELFSENAVYLDDWESLLQFVRLHEIPCLFYMFEYYIEEDFTISSELLQSLDGRVQGDLAADIRAHNAEISGLDFTQPCGLYIYCLHEGFSIIAELDDDWMENEGIEPASHAVRRILSEHMDTARDIDAGSGYPQGDSLMRGSDPTRTGSSMRGGNSARGGSSIRGGNSARGDSPARTGDHQRAATPARAGDRLQMMQRLTNYIMRDPAFSQCTNQRLRMRYIGNLLRRMPAYRAAFHGQHEYAIFIDAVWQECKGGTE